jgi:hypothetical protein
VLCASARLVCVRPLHVFLFEVRVEYNVHTYGLVHVFGNILGPATGQVVNVRVVSPVSFSLVLSNEHSNLVN